MKPEIGLMTLNKPKVKSTILIIRQWAYIVTNNTTPLYTTYC